MRSAWSLTASGEVVRKVRAREAALQSSQVHWGWAGVKVVHVSSWQLILDGDRSYQRWKFVTSAKVDVAKRRS